MKIEGKAFAIDLETRDPGLKERGPGWAFTNSQTNLEHGYPIGYAVSWFDGNLDAMTEEDLRKPETAKLFKSEYLPLRHEGGGNMEESEVRSIIGALVGDPDRLAIAANMGYDYGWTLWDGFDWQASMDDVQIQAPLLDDTRMSYSLDAISRDLLGYGKDESVLKQAAQEFGMNPKKIKELLWKLPGGLVKQYAEADAGQTLHVWAIQQHQMKARGLEEVHALERKLLPIIHNMRKQGVRVNIDTAEQLRGKFIKLEEHYSEVLATLTTVKIEPWTASTIVEALKNEGVTDFPLTEKKGAESTGNDFLKSIAINTPESTAGKIASNVLNLRRYHKARSTFIEGMIIGHAHNGRIHCQFNALRSEDGGTVTGRFSSSLPNLQQVPSRDPELGPAIRGCFEPEEGERWVSIDYSAQEPRLSVHFGASANVPGADHFVKLWNEDPRMDPYLPIAELCGITRKQAKIIKLGVLYGMGGGKLCSDLGLPAFPMSFVRQGQQINYLKAGPEGRKLLDDFDENSPMDRKLSELAQGVAKKRGYVKTILGRQASFPMRQNGERWFTHKALNRIIQGSAADMMKSAMVAVYDHYLRGNRTDWRMTLTVHDELAFSVKEDEMDRVVPELTRLMVDAIPLLVPVVCDVETGGTWGESMGD